MHITPERREKRVSTVERESSKSLENDHVADCDACLINCSTERANKRFRASYVSVITRVNRFYTPFTVDFKYILWIFDHCKTVGNSEYNASMVVSLNVVCEYTRTVG